MQYIVCRFAQLEPCHVTVDVPGLIHGNRIVGAYPGAFGYQPLQQIAARRGAHALTALAAFSSGATAQFASYTKSGTPCPNPKQIATLDGTLPIPGRTMSITTTAAKYAPGWLVFSPRWLGSRGIDLSKAAPQPVRSRGPGRKIRARHG